MSAIKLGPRRNERHHHPHHLQQLPYPHQLAISRSSNPDFSGTSMSSVTPRPSTNAVVAICRTAMRWSRSPVDLAGVREPRPGFARRISTRRRGACGEIIDVRPPGCFERADFDQLFDDCLKFQAGLRPGHSHPVQLECTRPHQRPSASGAPAVNLDNTLSNANIAVLSVQTLIASNRTAIDLSVSNLKAPPIGSINLMADVRKGKGWPENCSKMRKWRQKCQKL